jgi:hypothetical protein
MAYEDNFKVYGPYTNKRGRKIVIVIERNGERRTVSYPKWLMEIQLGRKLDPDLETIDHIDGDINNNNLSNFRILPRREHSAADTWRAKHVTLTCAWCGKKFKRHPKIVRAKAKEGKAGPFCSRACAGKYAKQLHLKLIKKFPKQKPVKSILYKQRTVKANSTMIKFFVKYCCTIID